jgi:PEP-CTERM motif-containing protein
LSFEDDLPNVGARPLPSQFVRSLITINPKLSASCNALSSDSMALYVIRNKIMRELSNWLVSALALCCGLMAGERAIGATLVSNFDNFTLNQLYASWADPNITTITSGPLSYTVSSVGYGSGYFDINPQINAAGETEIALDVTVSAASSLPGVILALVDGDGTFEDYRWYALTDGTHILTKTIAMPTSHVAAGSVPGLDLSTLDFFHIQVDGGGNGGRYSVSFNNLDLTTVPEPTSFALAAGGSLGIMCLRRRTA